LFKVTSPFTCSIQPSSV